VLSFTSVTSEFDVRAAGTRDGTRQTETATLPGQDHEIVEVTFCIQGRFGRQHVQNRD
jgi:hypothetical protein